MSETMGQRIRRLRLASSMTQSGLADRLIISKDMISDIEQDSTSPRHHHVIKLAAIFGVTEHYLAHGVESDADRRLADLKSAVLRWSISGRPKSDLQQMLMAI